MNLKLARDAERVFLGEKEVELGRPWGEEKALLRLGTEEGAESKSQGMDEVEEGGEGGNWTSFDLSSPPSLSLLSLLLLLLLLVVTLVIDDIFGTEGARLSTPLCLLFNFFALSIFRNRRIAPTISSPSSSSTPILTRKLSFLDIFLESLEIEPTPVLMSLVEYVAARVGSISASSINHCVSVAWTSSLEVDPSMNDNR